MDKYLDLAGTTRFKQKNDAAYAPKYQQIYGACTTSAASVAKEVAYTGYALLAGQEVIIKFTNGNSAANPTLNVGGTGAKPIYCNGSAIEADVIEANGTYAFVYNGTQYDFVGSAGGGGGNAESTLVAISPSDWSNNTCTKTVSGVTADKAVFVSYHPANKDNYTAADIYCTAQGNGTLTFACDTTPTTTIIVDVVIMDATDTSADIIIVSTNSVELDSETTYQDVEIWHTGSGTLSVVSNNTSVATVAHVSGNTYRITKVDTGETTITASVSGSSASIAVSVAQSVHIYGASWDGGSSPAWTRTDEAANFTDPVPAVSNGNGSSPFDNLMPWSGMQRVTDATAGTLVSIPKFWYKWTISGSTMKLQIADAETEGFSVSPAHADRGDGKGERDMVYVGAYHCASTYKSTTGVKPVASITRSSARSSIHNLGSTYWQYDYATHMTIWMLYLVEYANWNSQAKIGYGCGNNSVTENMGSTDSMTYHTGTNAASRTTYGHIRYRYIEDLWGNVCDWCDGIYFSSAKVYAIKNPANFSDSSGGAFVGNRSTGNGHTSAWSKSSVSGYDWFIYPSAVSGSDSTYVCDYCYYYSSGVVLVSGGNYRQRLNSGLFSLDGSSSASESGANVGCRLMKLP